MATNQASTTSPKSTPQPLWQAPLFLVGVAALAAAWFGPPCWPSCNTRKAESDLAAARQILSRQDGDFEEALQLAEAALDASETQPERAAESAFLAGSACVRLAEKADPVRARELWPRAQQHLKYAVKKGVSQADKPNLDYCLAKIDYHTGADVTKVIDALESSVPKCDRRAEGYAILTQAYLRLPKPDLAKAVEANAKLRDVAEATEAELASAKLVGGELLMRQGKHEEARKSLDRIGDDSPPAVLAKARLMQARSFQQEKRFADATALYVTVLAKYKHAVADPAVIHYYLGKCYRQLDQPRAAAKEFQECVTLSRGPEGQAAALALAEVRLAEPSLEGALEALTLAVARVNSPADWTNPLIPAASAAETFDKALAACRQASRHDLAMKLLDASARLTGPKRSLRQRAEVAGEWAKLKSESATSPEDQLLAKQLHKLAAEACDKLLEQPGLPLTEQGDQLWSSAQHYLTAGEKAQAMARLEQVVKLNLDPARLGEAWFRLAESYGADKVKALAAYRKCMEYTTRYAYLARYHLAMAALEAGDLDEAEAALVHNLKLLRWESDPEALAQSLFALGNLLYQRRDYHRLVRYLENALERFKDNPDVTKARFQLAHSYRQIASQENFSGIVQLNMAEETKAHFLKEHRRWLQKAADEFALLESHLESPEGRDHLTPEQRAQVPSIAAKCWADLGEHSKALAIYEKLVERHPGKQEQLDALGGAVLCHAELGQIEKVKQRLLQIKLLLPQMSEEVRQRWEPWHAAAVKMLRDPEEEKKKTAGEPVAGGLGKAAP